MSMENVRPYSPETVELWLDDKGRFAYEQYANHAEWTTYDGRRMPEWIDLTEAVRDHWTWSAQSVQRMVIESGERDG